jgi:hypothetical protein
VSPGRVVPAERMNRNCRDEINVLAGRRRG